MCGVNVDALVVAMAIDRRTMDEIEFIIFFIVFVRGTISSRI